MRIGAFLRSMFALVRGDLEDDQFRAEMARANRSVSYAGSSP
jgi:hypothetical protein